jgi:Outer membrane protein beta-barrel domain
MRLLPIAVAAALALPLGFVGSARAADDNLSGPASGPYVGAGWGRFNLDPENISEFGNGIADITKSHADAFKITAGYRFMPYFALEANYIDFGNPQSTFTTSGSDGNYKLHASGFAPMGVATLPLGPFEVFGKAGWLFSDNNVKVYLNQPGQQVIQTSHSSTDFMWGGGLGMTIFRHLNINAEYDRVQVENAHKSDVLWLAAQWRF